MASRDYTMSCKSGIVDRGFGCLALCTNGCKSCSTARTKPANYHAKNDARFSRALERDGQVPDDPLPSNGLRYRVTIRKK
jgi:hypothetical protein